MFRPQVINRWPALPRRYRDLEAYSLQQRHQLLEAYLLAPATFDRRNCCAAHPKRSGELILRQSGFTPGLFEQRTDVN